MVRPTRRSAFSVDTFDLYYALASRNAFTKEAPLELGFDVEVIKRDLGRVLRTLEKPSRKTSSLNSNPKQPVRN